MNHRDYRRRLRRYRWLHLCTQRQKLAATLVLIAVSVTLLIPGITHAASSTNHISATASVVCTPTQARPLLASYRASKTAQHEPCEALFAWPVNDPMIASAFDRPEQAWLPGHRGVDLQASASTILMAPADGAISFVGVVAGKDVVSIRHANGVTSTFEPAQTALHVGENVTKHQSFATVAGTSDHCETTCVHWGLKTETGDYMDPARYASRIKIMLKRVVLHAQNAMLGDYNA